jgi:predicted  nucleic acid-binding Zn-ribbon protein
MLTGIIGFQALRKATQIMQDADNAAFSMQTSVAAANREFDKVGSVQEWEQTVKDLSKELRIYSDTALKGAVSRTVDMTKRLGLSAEQMKVVIKRSADLGAGKVDLEGAIERVTAALRGEAESAEYLGLTLNENYVKSVYEADKANIKAWQDLTDLEKAQARYNVFLQQSEQFQGRAAASANTFGGALAEIRKEIINSVANSKDLNDAMGNVAKVVKENAGEIGKVISILVTAAARIVEFAVEWKKLLIILAGTGAMISIISKLAVVIKGLNAAFIVMTGSGIITWLGNLRAAINAVAVQAGLAGVALELGLAAAAAWGVLKIAELIKTIYEWRKAVKAQEESQQRLTDNTSAMMRRFSEFKGVKLPADITGASQRDLDEFRKKLASARAYYTALKMQLEQEGNTQALDKVNERLKEINADFKRVGESASSAATEMQKPAEAVKATEDQLKAFEEQAKKAYEEAKKQAKDYADKVIEFEEKIKYARLSTEDKIRELGRKGLDEAKAWADRRREAEEKLYTARRAMAEGDYKLAEKLAKDAEGLYADLATEVKGTEAGKEVVKQSIEETKKVAINGIKAVGDFVNQLYTTQKDAAQTAQTEWQATADGIKAQLDEIAIQREANINIELKGLIAAQDRINDLIKPEYKDIYIRIHETKARASGGPIYASTGKHLPGYGGGDKIPALLEAGEFVIRKEAVKKYGSGLFEALNAMRVDAGEIMRKKIGGIISNISMPSIPVPRYAYQTGGAVGGNETFTLRLQAGNVEMPINAIGNRQTARAMVKELEKELVRLGMVTR